jgi:general secretion pathway protein A
LTVVLAGQPELSARLNEDRLRQFKQRITLRCELLPLNLQETAAYISRRVRVAGGKPELLFTRDAVLAIHEHSSGIPRTVSVICDNALVNGFATDVKPVGRDLVLEVCRDFEFAGPTPAPKASAPPPRAVPEPPRPAATRVAGGGKEPELPRLERAKSLFTTYTRNRRFFIF